MQRLTITLDDETAQALDAHMAAQGYSNRSEANRDLCLEVAVLRGAVSDVQDFAQALIRERGVRFGGMNLLPAPKAGDRPPGPGTPHDDHDLDSAHRHDR